MSFVLSGTLNLTKSGPGLKIVEEPNWWKLWQSTSGLMHLKRQNRTRCGVGEVEVIYVVWTCLSPVCNECQRPVECHVVRSNIAPNNQQPTPLSLSSTSLLLSTSVMSFCLTLRLSTREPWLSLQGSGSLLSSPPWQCSTRGTSCMRHLVPFDAAAYSF